VSYFGIIFPLIAIFPAILATFLRRKYGYGVPKLTEPHCAKCGYDLRGYTAEPPTRCSECGADLTGRDAVRWGEMQRPRGVMFWSMLGLFLLVPLLLFTVVKRATIRPMPAFGPAALPTMSNQALLASLPQNVQQPWTWQELDRRLISGTLSNSETASAIDCLIADLSKQNQPGPLNWSQSFVEHAISNGGIGETQYTRLAQAFHGTAKLRIATKVRQGKVLAFTIDYGSPWTLPGVMLLKSLEPVKLADGTEFETTALNDPNNGRGIPNPDYLSSSGARGISGNLKIDLSPGEYVANFVLDAGEWVQGSAPNVDNEPGQPVHWPSPIRSRWTVQMQAPFEVVPADQSPVELVTDPVFDPQANGIIKVRSLRVIHFGTGQRIMAALSLDAKDLNYCFDATVALNGVNYPLGTIFASRGGVATWNGQCNLTGLAADVTSADLILRPDSNKAENAIGMGRIWGATVELLNQPLQRYDVRVQPPTTP
jgi:hypothetical protein